LRRLIPLTWESYIGKRRIREEEEERGSSIESEKCINEWKKE